MAFLIYSCSESYLKSRQPATTVCSMVAIMETTHVGSLPRDPELLTLLRQPDAPTGELSDAIERAVNDVVGRQRDVGITMISDGEQGKISYATYIVDRFDGLELQELPAIAA